METWCMAHPWLTFFLGLSAFGAIRVVVRGWPPSQADDGEGD